MIFSPWKFYTHIPLSQHGADGKHEYSNEFDLRKPLERHFLNGQRVDCVSIQDSPDLSALGDRCATFLSQFPWYYHSHSWSYIHKIGNIWSCCYISQCLILLLPVMSSPLQLHEEYFMKFQSHIFSVSTNLPLSFMSSLSFFPFWYIYLSFLALFWLSYRNDGSVSCAAHIAIQSFCAPQCVYSNMVSSKSLRFVALL